MIDWIWKTILWWGRMPWWGEQDFKVAFTLFEACTIVGGAGAAIWAILTWRKGQSEKARELRWNQAKSATQELDEFLKSANAKNALSMLQWDGLEYTVDRRTKFLVHTTDFKDALKEWKDECSEKEIFVQDCFHALFGAIPRLEHFLKLRLFTHVDVEDVFAYPVQTMAKHWASFEPFLQRNSYSRAQEFLARFPVWRGRRERFNEDATAKT